MSDLSIPPLAVAADTPFSLDRADRLARTLNLPLLEAPVADPRRCDRAQQLLWVGDSGLALQRCGRGAPGPVRVDWLDGKAAHRRQQGGGVGQLVARAVGLHKASRALTVVDATAGLGQDAFVLATLGAQVTLLERSPVMAALLEDGLARARACEDPDVQTILARMTLIPADSIAWLQDQPEVADVVYLDPMFPERGKSALVKKEMRVCRPVTGDDEDARELLAAARTAARSRVVVKRPRKGARIDGPEPDTVLSGKSSRYDLYTRRALP